MANSIRRRDVVTLAAGAAAWPLAGRAQQRPVPNIGFLTEASEDLYAHPAGSAFLEVFRGGLSEQGYIEGRNVEVLYRFGGSGSNQLRMLAEDLVARRVAVIVASGGPAPAHAAKSVTSTAPIVFATGADPVEYRLVASLNRPGGNVTGSLSCCRPVNREASRVAARNRTLGYIDRILVNPRIRFCQCRNKGSGDRSANSRRAFDHPECKHTERNRSSICKPCAATDRGADGGTGGNFVGQR